MIIEVKGKEFFEQSKKSAKITVFDFTATWCGPCKQTRPILEELLIEHEKKKSDIKFFSIDIDEIENKEITRQFDITAVPTVIFLQNGEFKKGKKFIGSRCKEDYAKQIDTLLKIK